MLAFSVALFSFLFLASYWLTDRVKKYALRLDMLDCPNARNLHIAPTPRGGGIGFALLILVSIGCLLVAFSESRNVWIGLLGGGGLIASIGWLDDRLNLSVKLRLVVHFTAAAWAVYWIGGLPRLELGLTSLPLPAVGGWVAVLAVVWFTNLYNFMDGIDGIAGSQAVVVGTTTAVILAILGHADLAVACGAMAASVGGFLAWNWPPAKIFMGDCGSGFLGFLVAVLALASEERGAVPLLVWAMLMSLFWIDATATLARRILAGATWHEAHCNHAYQRAVRVGLSHRCVTGCAVLINLGLSGLAIISMLRPNLMVPLVAISSGAILSLWYGITRYAEANSIAENELSEVGIDSTRSAA